MATLTVRNLDDDVVRALRIRAAEHGRSAEAEHRDILRMVLIQDAPSPPSPYFSHWHEQAPMMGWR